MSKLFVAQKVPSQYTRGTIYDIVREVEAYSNNRAVPQIGTEVATTSGTTVDVYGIPAWARIVVVNFIGVSKSGTEDILLQLGDSGGFETSGYSGSKSQLSASAVATALSTSTGFCLEDADAAAAVYHGAVTLTLEKESSNTWAMTSILARSDAAGVAVAAGSKSLSATLDRLRLTTTGSDTFDAGAINVLWQ